jgi:hypothetical protein
MHAGADADALRIRILRPTVPPVEPFHLLSLVLLSFDIGALEAYKFACAATEHGR